jgi:hypothetical protein
MRLYYFEVDDDKYLGEHDEDNNITLWKCMALSNARFFERKQNAKDWYAEFGQAFPGAELWSFECTDWKREE